MTKEEVGRPTIYSKETSERICFMVSETSQGLVTICKAKDMPSTTTIYRWLTENEEFRDNYTRAREAQADLLADEIIEIADDSSDDEVTSEDGRVSFNGEFAARSRIRVDARKWKASKLAPKKYGDKLDLSTLGDKINNVDLSHLSFEQLEKLAKANTTGSEKGASKA